MPNLRYAIYRAGLETLYFSGAHRALRPIFGGVGSIFTLHHVRPGRPGRFQPNRFLEIEAEFLERMILRLRARGIELVSMDEVHRRLVERDFARYFVAFTLDDGYLDNYEQAWPVFKRQRVPFTLYVATSFPDKLGELWWLVLERVVARNDRIVVEMEGQPRFFNCASVSGKRQAFGEIYQWLRGLSGEAELRRAIRDLAARYGIDMNVPCRELCMTWAQIAEMAEDPLCTIGAHTINHVALRRETADVARTEMKRSADVIESTLGKRPEHFAYPYGGANAAGVREFALARELGFKTAVTTRAGALLAGHREHLTALPRISINGEFQALRYIDVLVSGLPFVLAGTGGRVEAA
ncbi:MAG: polysaccharide deacetylase family protein [Bradyrhizobiaceae bacterium]|nr:polysaccharide deacetylase family protein [Bradyrhizobiaceae bacterium]